MPLIHEVKSVPWPLAGNQRLAWYSNSRSAFVIGNHADKCVLMHDTFTIAPLVKRADSYAPKAHAYDDQLSPADEDGLRQQGIDGFQPLTRDQYDVIYAGQKFGSTCPVDQALISGLSNGLPVLHPGSGAIVSFATKRVTLHALGDSLKKVGEAKTPDPITSVCAGPDAIYLGTNHGDLFAVPISRDAIGKATKRGAHERVVNSIRTHGDRLFVGGMGYVASYSIGDGAPKLLAKQDLSCRGISILNDRWLLLNQGMHGLRLCEVSNNQIRGDVSLKLTAPVDRVICGPQGRFVLAIGTPPAGISVCSIQIG